MVHSRFLNHVLVFVIIASIFSTLADANRGFSSGWGEGSNYSSGSGSTPWSGWGWGSSGNGTGWGWGWGWSSPPGPPNNRYNSRPGGSG